MPGQRCWVTLRTSAQWQSLRDLEAIILGKLGIFLVPAGFSERRLIFLVVNIGNALEEQQRKNVCLEIRSIHSARAKY